VGRTGALLGGVIVVAVTGLVAAGDDVAGWELDVGRWAFDLPDRTTPMLEAVMQAGTRLAPIVVAAALALAAGWRWRAAAVLVAGLAAWGVAQWAKDVVDRPRPTAAALGRNVREVVDGPGYPSTHTAVAAGVAVAVLLLLDRRSPVVVGLLVAVPVLTGLARLHLGVHWGLDVVGGAAIGTSAAALVALAVSDRR
jgi:undecaprenyl-diphosphatase